jgi:hypothetical protein
MGQVYSHSETETRSCRVIKYKKTRSRGSCPSPPLFTMSHAPHASPADSHTPTPDHAVAASSPHTVVAVAVTALLALTAAAPRRAVRRSAGFVEFSGFPRVLRRRRFALVLGVASCPTSTHTGLKTTSAPLVCNESSPTSERSKSRVDSTRADRRACDALKQNWLSVSAWFRVPVLDMSVRPFRTFFRFIFWHTSTPVKRNGCSRERCLIRSSGT